jgi:hypothetical protein
MKYLQLFFIIVLITGCSGTKRVVENTKKAENPEVSQIADSISKGTEAPLITAPKTVEIKQNEVTPVSKNLEVFNHNSWNILLQKHVSGIGNVNYKNFKTDRKELLNYLSSLGDTMPNDNWTKEDKLAYWINAYNAMTIDLILQNYPIKSIKDIKDPWGQRLWKLGNKWYNLNDIEHEILRKMDEPRIHFAIVCASYSCPKLQNKAFYAENLKEQLTNATKEFLSDSERNEISENDLKLSKIFQWFTKDFKQNGSLIDFLNTYSEIQISEKAKINYKDYNWDLNE